MLQSQKHLFSLHPEIHYLNCAYKAPLLKEGEEAALRALVRDRNPIDLSPSDFFSEAEEVKVEFGKLVNCRSSQVAVIPSTSYALGNVFNNLHSRRGQNAITVQNEFPSDYFAVQNWCDTQNAELRIIAPNPALTLQGEDYNNRLLDSIDENTAVVILSSIHWMNGLKFDLKSIGEKCERVGAAFIVDGTQSVGALPMDIQEYKIDALICAGYKWLFGPYSLGLCYMGDRFNNGTPIEQSWMNRTNAKDFSSLTQYGQNYTPDAGRYNMGEVSNFTLMPILKQGLLQLHQWGIPAMGEYCKELIQPLKNYLIGHGQEFEDEKYFSNHLFSLRPPVGVDMGLLKQNLLEEKIYVSVRGDSLRVSINVFNTSQDIEKLTAVVDTLVNQS